MNAMGVASTCTPRIPLRGAVRSFLGAALTMLCLLNAGCNTSPAPGPQVTETRISILQLNLRGVLDVPFGDSSENWVTRFNRVGPDLQRLQVTPDVIALQEVVARVWCPDNWTFLKDYEPLHALIASLEAGTGTRFRIESAAPIRGVGARLLPLLPFTRLAVVSPFGVLPAPAA